MFLGIYLIATTKISGQFCQAAEFIWVSRNTTLVCDFFRFNPFGCLLIFEVEVALDRLHTSL